MAEEKEAPAAGPLCAHHPLAAWASPPDPTWEEQSYLVSQQLEKPKLRQVDQLTEATQHVRDRWGQAAGAPWIFSSTTSHPATRRPIDSTLSLSEGEKKFLQATKQLRECKADKCHQIS